MNRYVFCWLMTIFFSLFIDIYSQKGITTGNFDPEIMKNSYYRNGIYTNINQFLCNSPKYDYLLSLKGNSLMYHNGNTNKFERFTKPNWGVCINNQIYVKHSGKYVLVQPTGRFSFFIKHGQVLGSKSLLFEGSGITRPELQTVNKEYFIDFKTNKRYKLSAFNIKNILKIEDKDLYDEYLKTAHRKYFLKDFLIKLNNKYNPA